MYEAADPLGHSNPPTDTLWVALNAELDAWAAAGRTATLWWRDDDAGAMNDALDRLLRLRGARDVPIALAGLRQNNVHIDPIDWRGRHGPAQTFVGAARAIDAAVDHLAARRTGTADSEEATGLMTHHLVQDDETWQFVEQFIAHTQAHPAVRWLAAADVFGLEP